MKLFYREYGTEHKQHLIILHGLFGMSDNWIGHAKAFARHHHVVVPDMRNHGQSPHSDDFSFELMAEDLNELMAKLNIGQCVLLGHSMGGRLAMNFSLNHPERVDKLIVADMSLRKGKIRPEHRAILSVLSVLKLSDKKTYGEIDESLKRFISNERRRQFVLKNIVHAPEGFKWKINPGALIRNIDKIMPELKSDKRYIKPALFIRGGASDYITDEDIPAIKEHFPMARIETIEGASHWLHADSPATFRRLVNEFLEQ
jgi:pimeloyl-ACP methyl ester carboxylesterase